MLTFPHVQTQKERKRIDRKRIQARKGLHWKRFINVTSKAEQSLYQILSLTEKVTLWRYLTFFSVRYLGNKVAKSRLVSETDVVCTITRTQTFLVSIFFGILCSLDKDETNSQ